MKSKLLKYRWIFLSALVVWAWLVLTIAFGTARRQGITVAYSFVPLAMLLVVSIPVSVTRIARYKWGFPIAVTWSCSTSVAIHFVGTWLLGYGYQCNRIILVVSASGFCILNIGWVASKLWRQAVIFIRRKWVRLIQAAAA